VELLVVELAKLGFGIQLLAVGHELSVTACTRREPSQHAQPLLIMRCRSSWLTPESAAAGRRLRRASRHPRCSSRKRGRRLPWRAWRPRQPPGGIRCQAARGVGELAASFQMPASRSNCSPNEPHQRDPEWSEPFRRKRLRHPTIRPLEADKARLSDRR
jgi:hypothetical protein